MPAETGSYRPQGPQSIANSRSGSALILRKAYSLGLLGGVVMVLTSAMGLLEAFHERTILDPFLSLGSSLLFFVPVLVGYVAAAPPEALEGMEAPRLQPRNLLAGTLAGLIAGALLALLVIVAGLVDLRTIFINISPTLLDLVTFDLGPGVGLIALLLVTVTLATIGSGIHLLPANWRVPLLGSVAWVLAIGLLQDLVLQLLRGLGLSVVGRFLFESTGGMSLPGAAVTLAVTLAIYSYLGKRGALFREQLTALPETRRRNLRYAAIALLIIAFTALPQVAGSYISEVFDLVGLFLLMGLGLNIVVGFAGLLDLGYVAFFAVGAYATAVLTSPSSPRMSPELTFWLALPFVMMAAVLAGILVGAPVLRMRGDYLAIVTLGFGEIARLLAQSDWLKPILGGAQGILRIPNITIGPIELHTPPELFYPIAAFCLLAAYISWRLQDSRIGRAWMAMREDEGAAEAMGINIVTAKLLAFISGAILASFSGAIFAMKIGSVFPHSFKLIFSITVLVLIIIGGLGSLRGVVVGAVVIVGLPELLREFDEFRELFYGVLLILMMRLKPEGLLPSARRARELHEEEVTQDAWQRLAEQAGQRASAD